MASEKLETERKYEAGAGAALPDLAGLPGVSAIDGPREFRLEADYFDTAGLRLLQAGITLRRRRGGDDAGWHLKLPAGPDSRRELQLPPGRGSVVPAELSRLVRAHARGARLAPVATIITVRRQRVLRDGDGASLAEVVEDQVAAHTLGEATETLQWREIEVELTGGTRKLLQAADARLRAAGLERAGSSAKLHRVLASRLPAPAPDGAAPPTPRSAAGEVVLAYLHGQAAVLTATDPAVRRDEPDSVHDMRVACRRLRSVLQTFTPVLPAEATAHLQAELKWLGQVLGEARDGEVLEEHLRVLIEQLPAALVLGPVQATVTEHLSPRHAAARRAMLRALNSRRYLALLDELDALLAGPPLTDFAARPADALLRPAGRSWRRLRRRVRHAWSLPPGPDRDAALHEARKAAKRARYAAEVLVPSAGQPARRFAARMKEIQSVLGDHQDAAIARAAIRDLGLRAHRAGDNAFTFGVLHERDAQAGRDLQRQARRAWQRAAKKKYRRWLA
ncbi:MAG TPA: CYTH and CHAD domain-containing protein [Streptosporangiaceae bacterium]|nr:CYTH and CHAD domain-containing protein [Streptosporangiaceae bacterium]